VSKENGVEVYRPDALLSAGLTSAPNLPVETINDNIDPMNDIIIALLTKRGVTVAADATPEQIGAKLEQHIAEQDNKVQVANSKVTTAETQLATARTETTTANTTANNYKTQFENERNARISSLLDIAITAGRITAAEKATWEGRLKNPASFENEANALTALPVGMKTKAVQVDLGDRKVEASNAKDRSALIQELVTAKMAKGMTYDAAFTAVQREQSHVFDVMQQPKPTK
jgi:hypothetical protein